jgi:hypothetical protein
MESFIKPIPKNKNENKSGYTTIKITNFNCRVMAKALVNKTIEINSKIVEKELKMRRKNLIEKIERIKNHNFICEIYIFGAPSEILALTTSSDL